MSNKRLVEIKILLCLLFSQIEASGYTVQTADQTSRRTNTLFDDADDIQRQLDNEARDRLKYGRPKTIWVFHLPSTFPSPGGKVMGVSRPPYKHMVQKRDNFTEILKSRSRREFSDWTYEDQDQWSKQYPACGGRSQSPVNLPVIGLVKTKGARELKFINFEVIPESMALIKDGKQLILYGTWPSNYRPIIYGGAAHSRRYLFHSLTIHSPSEHRIANIMYPLETQLLFVSAEYDRYKDAVAAASDRQSFLVVSTLYKYSNHTHEAVSEILERGKDMGIGMQSIMPKPLRHFCPSFKDYVCYQGSLTVPPCTESVLWLIRAKALHIKRELADIALTMITTPHDEPKYHQLRRPQPLNDRKVFLF